MNIALGPQDIVDLVGKKVTLISNAKSNLNELYHRIRAKSKISSRYIIHYQTKDSNGVRSGHWCGLVIKNNEIWFYDPYGEYPDDQLNHIDMKYRKDTRQSVRKLGRFLYKASNLGYKIIWNSTQHQKKSPLITTCGRWVAEFLRSGLNPDEFNKYVNVNHITDESIIK